MKSIKLFIKHYKFLSISIFLLAVLAPIFVIASSIALPMYRVFGNGAATTALLPIKSNPVSSNDYQTSGVCFNNTSATTYMVPNKTYGEWSSFYNKVISNPGVAVPGVTLLTTCCADGICNGAETCQTCIDCGECPSPYHTLTYQSSIAGTITGSSTQVVANGASGTTVTANPVTGYDFQYWEGNPSDDQNTFYSNVRQDVNVTKNITVIAKYIANPCGWGLCDDACTQNCSTDYITNFTFWLSECQIDPCYCGYCDSQCGYYCPGGYYIP